MSGVNSGVRQGDSLSPTLFYIFINDLINELNTLDMGIDINGRNVCSLLYADDLVVFSDSEVNLQCLLDKICVWCKQWKMKINHEKSNIVHFRKNRKLRTNFVFKFGNIPIDIVSNYKYLGLFLDEHMNYEKAVDTLCGSAGRALGSVINKFKSLHNIGFSTFTKLYNSCVHSVMEYGSAIWTEKRYIQCNKIFNRAIRYFLGVPRGTPIAGMKGDMEWIPPKFSRMINKLRFWNRVVSMHPDRLTRQVFEWDWLSRNNNWSMEMYSVFKMLDMETNFNQLNVCDKNLYLTKIQFLVQEEWRQSLEALPKLRTYRKM